MDIRLTGTFRTLSPLSHIGESISTCSYLVQEPILQPDGSLEEVFCYSGNAWRGQLRDLCAGYMLDRLGNARVPLDMFHLLFSGGKIGGDQVVDIERVRTVRRAIPMLALFGGGIGNQIMPGKLRVANSYPVCREAMSVIPDKYHPQALPVSYRSLTFEKSFSRKDDTKDERLQPHIAAADHPLLAAPDKKKTADEVATQMRMTCELLIAGATLCTEIEALDVSEVELGCLVAALHRFSVSPHIGGQANKGHGRVAMDYRLLDLDSGETRDFVCISHGPAQLSQYAAAAKDRYDIYLKDQYDALLASQQTELRGLLGAA